MSNKDIAIRFTEEKYATKQEVIRELRISSVDSFWNAILEYRSNFYHLTQLKSIDKKTFVFCACPSIYSLISSSENKLIKVNRSYSSLYATPLRLKYFSDLSLSKCLKYVSDKMKLDLDDHYLLSLVRNEIQDISDSIKPLQNYLKALNYIKNSHVNNIDEDYLANLYAILLGTEDLVSFYRTSEDKARNNQVVIGRMYTCAPSHLIEGMMESLFSFLKTSTLPSGVKAGIAYYYINYVRPFDEYSDELAILIAKSVLGHETLGELCIYFPYESLLSSNIEVITRLFNEVQKNTDLTYFVNYFFQILSSNSDALLDTIANLNAEEMRNDYYREENTSKEVNENNIEQPLVETNEVVVPSNAKKAELAISYIPSALDEKQATLIEQDLLERDPSLRKGEAHFYARHCTKGKMYTIAQYKKSIGCVYETARTSMDHLAELGYYRKEKIKNKFVYIPISRN